MDPQPRAGGVREALQQLRGARITGFTAKDKSYSLKYELGPETRFAPTAAHGAASPTHSPSRSSAAG